MAVEMKWQSSQQAQLINSLWNILPYPRADEESDEEEMFITQSTSRQQSTAGFAEEKPFSEGHFYSAKEGTTDEKPSSQQGAGENTAGFLQPALRKVMK